MANLVNIFPRLRVKKGLTIKEYILNENRFKRAGYKFAMYTDLNGLPVATATTDASGEAYFLFEYSDSDVPASPDDLLRSRETFSRELSDIFFADVIAQALPSDELCDGDIQHS